MTEDETPLYSELADQTIRAIDYQLGLEELSRMTQEERDQIALYKELTAPKPLVFTHLLY